MSNSEKSTSRPSSLPKRFRATFRRLTSAFRCTSGNKIAPEEGQEKKENCIAQWLRNTCPDPNFIFRILLWIAGYNLQKYKWNEKRANPKLCSLRFLLDGLTTWWILLTIFSVSVVFTVIQPTWDSHRIRFVPLEDHDLTSNIATCDHFTDHKPTCLTSNETSLLSDTHINRFIQTLHTIIAKSGCEKLDRQNIAAKFEDDRPLIEDIVIFHSLIHSFGYSTDDARLLIKTCRVVFEQSSHDVVIARENGFIYLNDYLMNYCGFKTGFITDQIYMLISLFFVFYITYAPWRKIFLNEKDRLLNWYFRNWFEPAIPNSPLERS